MVNLEQLYVTIDNKLSDNRTKDEKLRQNATERLSVLYNEQSENLDKIMDEVDKSLNMEDIEYTYRLIKRLSRNLQSDRQHLLSLLKEVL